MVQGRYKLIVDLFKDETFYELYDLETDVQETNNLMFDREYDGIAKAMAERLTSHMKATGDLITLESFDGEGFRDRYERFPVL